MFLGNSHHEAYWNSYRLLESQLLRLSHSICFDDTQINVYSSELADIVNSACIKIESLAKDIYEDHIWPFQEDIDIVPPSFTGKKFKPDRWTRDNWKFDHNCLIEIDRKYALSKKRIQLKSERFRFYKYGSTILPFGTIFKKDERGGYWEYSKRDPWQMDTHKFEVVGWLESYQEIKHNYIQSIPKHGTIKNAILALAAFYLLVIYASCLPARQFEIEKRSGKQHMDFGSELFYCSMMNYLVPPCIIDSDEIKWRAEQESKKKSNDYQDIYREQDLMNDIEGCPFLIILNQDAYKEVCKMVEQYCVPRDLEYFDLAPYESNKGQADTGSGLYAKIIRFITSPVHCITFNIGTEHAYDNYDVDLFDYEKSKHKIKTAAVLSEIKVGDLVDAVFVFDEEVSNGEVVKLDDHCIDLAVDINGTCCITSQPKANVISIRKTR